MTKLNVDLDGDQKPDFQVDFKTLILRRGNDFFNSIFLFYVAK